MDSLDITQKCLFYPTGGDKVFKENNVIKFVKSTLALFPCRCGVTWEAEV